jgi:divalent metal cation (Fe/Co/Zn/Cd) transporter
VFDGAASIAIGVLLIVVAVRLGLDSRELLIGRAADPKLQEIIRTEIERTPGVDRLVELQTMHVGPDSIIVAARVDLADDARGDQVENLAEDIDQRLAERLPVTPDVFVDPTPGGRPLPASPAGETASG